MSQEPRRQRGHDGASQTKRLQITADAADAETVVVNTCGFIDSAKKESIDTILEAAQLKTNGQAKRLIVAGCLVERYRDELKAEIPEVDAFIGTNQINDILAVCDPKPTRARFRSCRSAIRARRISTTNQRHACCTPSHYAFVKIAEGCDRPCAFCFIPQMRGHFRSRRFGSIVARLTSLLKKASRSSFSWPRIRRVTAKISETGCTGASAARTAPRRRHRMGARHVHLSDAHQRRLSRRACRRAQGGEVSRHAFAARFAKRSETDEAWRQSQKSRATDRARANNVFPVSPCEPRSSPAFRVKLRTISMS